jgi:uncharacterized repeat protein (TIGR03803 family)
MPSKSLFSAFSRISLLIAAVLLLPLAVRGQSTFKVLHNFTGRDGDGGGVWCSVAFDSAGNLYGTTSGGGAYGYGTVFELSPNGDGSWTETVLHSFMFDDPDGSEPQGGLVLDGVGNLYGTTTSGGANGRGTVFELTPGPSGWTDTVLYSFCLQLNCTDGASPFASMLMDGNSNLFGVAGLVFELSPVSEGWSESVLYTFTGGSDGAGPYAGVIRDRSGNLYGTTEAGGTFLGGTVYEVKQVQGSWTERVLHSFASSPTDGVKPGGGQLALDSAGNLYGTTNQGGSNLCVGIGCGTVYKLSRSGSGRWKETLLYNFQSVTGYGPGAGVMFDKSGTLYGTTVYGGSGACGCGLVYKLAPGSGGSWTYSVLHTFTSTDGAQPDANLVLHNGKLYGTTIAGGTGGAGVVFEITP